MQAAENTPRIGMRRDLAGLMAASVAGVLLLVGGIAAGGEMLFGLSLKQLSVVAVIGGMVVLGLVLAWFTAGRARREAQAARNESADLRRSLAAADSVIRSEPQILVSWAQNEPLRVVAQSLRGVPGLPDSPDRFLRFGQWLEHGSGATL
jgi:hypothetical protein